MQPRFLLALLSAPVLALAQAVPPMPSRIVTAPQLAPGAIASTGTENVLADVAVMPSQFLRRDLNGVLLPGGFRLSTWANLSSRSFANGRVRIVTNFRFDLDTSATTAETNVFKPYLSPTRYSLLAAYVEADAAQGLLIRAGRQFHADAADYLAFDGGKVLWTLGSLPVRLELYGGVRTNTAIATGSAASSLYELDGVQSVSGAQPMAGTVLRYLGNWRYRSEASVGFRWSWRSMADDAAKDAALPTGLATTAQELMASAGGDLGPVHLSGGASYEVVLGTLMRARATATLSLGKLLAAAPASVLAGTSVALEYRRYRPTFALDSIFNYFSLNPYDEYSALGSVQLGPRWRAEARWFERRFLANTETRDGVALVASPGSSGAHGARVGAFASFGELMVDAAGQLQLGLGGTRALIDGGARLPLAEHFELYARASVAYFAGDLRATSSGGSLGLVGGATWYLPQGASVSLLVEETVNPLTHPAPRVFAVADLARWL